MNRFPLASNFNSPTFFEILIHTIYLNELEKHLLSRANLFRVNQLAAMKIFDDKLAYLKDGSNNISNDISIQRMFNFIFY